MKTFHTTHVRNLPSILSRGLLASKSTGKRKAVWLHLEDLTGWAFMHAVRRHGGRVEQIVRLTVDVPEEGLVHHGNGLYYFAGDIGIDRIFAVETFGLVSRSPVEDCL